MNILLNMKEFTVQDFKNGLYLSTKHTAHIL